MRFASSLRSLLVLILALVPATPALANSLASWVWIWPGMVSSDPLFGLLPTVLASFVERPFISRAGVDSRPLLRSIRLTGTEADPQRLSRQVHALRTAGAIVTSCNASAARLVGFLVG